MTITYFWIPHKISIQEYKSARLDSPSSCSIVHYNVLVDWHLCHLRRTAVWARWEMLNNILVSRNTRPMPRSVMSIKLQKPFNLWNRCLEPYLVYVTYLRIFVQIRVRARWKNLTFLIYEFGQGQNTFHLVKLSRFPEKMKFLKPPGGGKNQILKRKIMRHWQLIRSKLGFYTSSGVT